MQEEIKTEISTDCSYYKDVVKNEIIIDGVDVAGCILLCGNDGYKICCADDIRETENPFHTFCEDNPNCYYKQLKRLEQENEKLKKEVKQIGSDFIKKGDYARELEQENKELKKDVQLFKCLDTFGENECHCACRCLGNEFCEDADKKINSYRSALEEIRELAEKSIEISYNLEVNSMLYDIKHKINECIGE